MKLILFDIDGTLLFAGGIGRRSTKKALEMVFGTSGNLDKFYPGGRTQEAIFIDTLADAGIAETAYLDRRDELYKIFLDHFREGISTENHQIRSLPGALVLLEWLNQQDDIALGIVTGNHQEIGRLKLTHAGIDPDWFTVWACGHLSANRSDLVPYAQQLAETIYNEKFSGKSTIVIGDTTRDIKSAQSVGAMSIAVTTGTDSRDLLESVEPDHILDGLNDLEEVLKIIGLYG